MLMDAVLERFVAHRPMAVAVRGAFEYALDPTDLDGLFVRTVGHRDDRELLFPMHVDLRAAVVCGVNPSVHAACQAHDHLPVNVTATHARLARVPATAGRDLVRHTAAGTGSRTGSVSAGPIPGRSPSRRSCRPTRAAPSWPCGGCDSRWTPQPGVVTG